MTLNSLHLPQNRARAWRWIFLLAALEGLAALVYLASLPSDGSGRLLGYSAGRLLLMALLLVLAAGCALLAWIAGRRWFSSWLARPHRRLWPALLVLLPLVALGGFVAPAVLFDLYRTGGDFRYFAVGQRLLPLFAWLALASLEVFAGVIRTGAFCWSALGQQRGVLRSALVVWVGSGLVAAFAMLTGIGLRPDVVGWGRPAVALLEWQILLAWAVSTAFLLLITRRGWPRRADICIAAAIWLLAAVLWLSQPIRPAFFATPGRAPNFEIYPFSDGAYYGSFAQSLLIGNGFKGQEIPPRPFYITLLAGFHAIAGQKYENVISLQTLLLAFFPVILYYLGKALHSRPAGLVMALLAILREWTAIIATPFTDNASNSKLFFADLPTAAVASLWVLLVVLWLKTPGRPGRAWLPLVAGGGIGLAMLFRTQSMFMIPAALLLALLAYRARWGRWLRAAALFALGLALMVAPWLLRNYAVLGQFAFDDPKSQTGSMAARYSLSGSELSYVYQPGEDLRTYSTRVTKGIFNFLFTHPGIVARFVAGHLVNSEIDNAFILPIRSGLAAPGELLAPATAFWESWGGAFSPGQAFQFAIHLGLVALGIGAAWSRLRWAGLVPLLANLSYNFSMALARNSGGRYLLAVDWVIYVYAAMGLIEITLAVLSVIGLDRERLGGLLARVDDPEHLGSKLVPKTWSRAAVAGLACLLLGSLLPAAELAAPRRYADLPRASLLAIIEQDPRLAQSGLDQVAVERLASRPGMQVLRGRALYPRYYAAGDGEPSTAKTAYEPLDYARTVFLMTSNTYNGLLVLRASEPPDFFPNASDVVVIGCPGPYIDVALLVVEGSPGGAYASPEVISKGCPAGEP